MFQRYLPLIGHWILYLKIAGQGFAVVAVGHHGVVGFSHIIFFLVCPILLFFFPLFLRRLKIDHDTI